MIQLIKKKMNPPCYQGMDKKSRHFEGWYFKIVDKDENHCYAIIPGIFISDNNTDSHSFIQIFDGVKNRSYYYKFPIEDFNSEQYDFNIQINSNNFSSNRIALDLNNSSHEITAELRFSDLTHWPKTLISPGIMGWYSWVPFMECYHGIVSLHHKIQGSISIDGHNMTFSDGLGYTEKDWGRSFPEAWVWFQSNHFNTINVSLTGSIAIIPWIRRPFPGFIFGLWYQYKLYRFTTYTNARLIRFEIDDKEAHCVIKQNKLILEIIAYRSEGGYLQAPTINGMTHQISETLNSILEIKLSRETKKRTEILFQDAGRNAGFEMAGDINRLLAMYNKMRQK